MLYNNLAKFVLTLLLVFGIGLPAYAVDTGAPALLKNWQDWILTKHPNNGCPWSDKTGKKAPCVWYQSLDIDAKRRSADFRVQVRLFKEGWIQVPGDKNLWPTGVRNGNRQLTVVNRQGIPFIRMSPGNYSIRGQFTWSAVPAFIQYHNKVADIEVKLNRNVLSNNFPDQEGRFWLKQPTSDNEEEQASGIRVQVFRKLNDGIPMIIDTQVVLNISGQERDIQIGKILLDGFELLTFNSPLAGSIDKNGLLNLKARAGRWIIKTQSRQAASLPVINLMPVTQYWPDQEIWVLNPDQGLRAIELKGGQALDPQQTNLPDNWKNFAAFLVRADQPLKITETFRGNVRRGEDNLILDKSMWLDFSGHEWVVRDRIGGVNASHWRFNAQKQLVPGFAQVAGSPQVITLDQSQQPGIEIRQRQVDAKIVSTHKWQSDFIQEISGSGWQLVFDRIRVDSHLPSGWRNIAVIGSDWSHGDWLAKWNLWSLFIWWLLAIAAGRLMGLKFGLLTLVLVGMIYHDPIAPRYSLLIVLGLLGLATLATVKNWLDWIQKLQRASFSIVLLLSFGFALQQLHWFIFLDDTLEKQSQPYQYNELNTLNRAEKFADLSVHEAQSMAAPSTPSLLSKSQSKLGQDSKVPLEQRIAYAPTQTGPSVPEWHGVKSSWGWNSIVNDNQTVHLLLSPPWLSRVGVLVQLILLMLLIKGLINHLFPSIPTSGNQRQGERGESESNDSDGGIVSNDQIDSAVQNEKPVAHSDQSSPNLFVDQSLKKQPARIKSSLSNSQQANSQKTNSPKTSSQKISVGKTLSIWFMALFSSIAVDSVNANFPSESLLKEYETRLLAPPLCGRQCGAINSAYIQIDKRQFYLQLSISVDTLLDVPLPIYRQQWWPETFTINGRSERRFGVDSEGRLRVVLDKGNYEIVLKGPVAGVQQFQLDFEWPALNVKSLVRDWSATGILNGRLSGRAVTFERNYKSQVGTNKQITPINPFAKLTRKLFFENEWYVVNELKRIAPKQQGFNIKIPLLPGEEPLTQRWRQIDGKLEVNFEFGQNQVIWRSSLNNQSNIQISAEVQNQWIEDWLISSSPQWNIRYQGIEPVSFGKAERIYHWRPWPGETVNLEVSQPNALLSKTLTVDRFHYELEPGERLVKGKWQIQSRSSQGQGLYVDVPEGMHIQSIMNNGRFVPVIVRNQKLELSVPPGLNTFEVNWTSDHRLSHLFQVPEFSASELLNNVHYNVNMPEDRWILFVWGPEQGPQILYWPILLLVFVLAFKLNNKLKLPIGRMGWVLLAMGLATASLWSFVVFAVWMLALSFKFKNLSKWQDAANWQYNFFQLGLILLGITALLLLTIAIPDGLLGNPDMQISGAGSFGHYLRWYQDRMAAESAQVMVFSLPMWVYKVVMLMWAFWLASQMIRWLKWSWACYSAGKWWRSNKK